MHEITVLFYLLILIMDFFEIAQKGINMISSLNKSVAQQISDKDITIMKVIDVLESKVILSPSILRETQYLGETKEGRIQKSILKQLSEIFGKEKVQKEYNVGGYWGMRCDIDLFDGKIGIELKVAEQLKKSTQVERLIGQAVYYSRRKYDNGNLIVLVVGKKKEYDASMKEIEAIIADLGVNFVYKAVD